MWSRLLKKSKKGFTIIELMTTVFVVSIGLIGTINLFSNVLLYTNDVSSKLTAAYLSQEGIEIVRNIRDTSWLKGEDWVPNLPVGQWRVDYQTQSLLPNGKEHLNIDSTGFYSYFNGELTKFQRKINIKDSGTGREICAVTTWRDHQVQRKVEACDILYDWK